MTDAAEREFHREMRNRLFLYEQERGRSHRAGIKPPKPDIDTLAYKVAIEVRLKRTFGRILPELVKYRDEIRQDIRRYLIERLRKRAAAMHERGELERGFRTARERRAAAEHCVWFWNAIARQLERPCDVTSKVPRNVTPKVLRITAGGEQ